MNLGAAFICIPIGILINITGRKYTMLMLIIPFTIGWSLIIFAANVVMLYIGRILLGIAGGAFCVTAPIYTAEIADKNVRGTLGSFFQLMITIGILFAYIVGSKVTTTIFSIICAFIPLIFGAIFVFMPETPFYLIKKCRYESAVKSIKWFRGKKSNYDLELTEMKEESEQNRVNKDSMITALRRAPTIRALVISFGLMFFQQMSGCDAVIFYTNAIFDAAKTKLNPADATIILGVMQVIATLGATIVVDKIGRRILLLISSSVMALCTIIIGFYFHFEDKISSSFDDLSWLPILCLCIFIITFSFGFGPIPWMMIGELFAPDVKGLAASMTGTFNWILTFIVTKTFGNLISLIDFGPTFWVFSIFSILGFIFVFLVVPETKGKTLHEIQLLLGEIEYKKIENNDFNSNIEETILTRL